MHPSPVHPTFAPARSRILSWLRIFGRYVTIATTCTLFGTHTPNDTVWAHSLGQRKWRETKLQPSSWLLLSFSPMPLFGHTSSPYGTGQGRIQGWGGSSWSAWVALISAEMLLPKDQQARRGHFHAVLSADHFSKCQTKVQIKILHYSIYFHII